MGGSKITLVYAPCVGQESVLELPPIGLGYLAGALRGRGIEVDCRDLDLEYHQEVEFADPYLRELMSTLQTEKAYSLEALVEVAAVRRLLQLSSSSIDVDRSSLDALEQALRARAQSLSARERSRARGLRRFLEARARELADGGVLGISVIYPEQALPAARLARLVKERNPDCSILVGGPAMLRFTHDAFRDAADAIVLGEAEPRIAELVTAPPRAKRGVPEIIRLPVLRDLDTLVAPDYTAFFDKYRYYCPERTVPLAITRGCYWNRCTFCSYGWARDGAAAYRKRSVERTVEDLRELKSRHRARFFSFSVDVADPALLRRLAEALIGADLDIRYKSQVRVERQFLDEQLLSLLYRSGCRGLGAGNESLNDRVLKQMDKGVSAQANQRWIEALLERDIVPATQFFCGFPSETPSEANETFEKLVELNIRTSHVFNGISSFELLKDSKVYTNPEQFGVQIDRRTGAWTVRAGMQGSESKEQVQIFRMALLYDPRICEFPKTHVEGVLDVLVASRLGSLRALKSELRRVAATPEGGLERLVEAFDSTFHYLQQLASYAELMKGLKAALQSHAAAAVGPLERLENDRAALRALIEDLGKSGLGKPTRAFLSALVELDFHNVRRSFQDDGKAVVLDRLPPIVPLKGSLQKKVLTVGIDGHWSDCVVFPGDADAVSQRKSLAAARRGATLLLVSPRSISFIPQEAQFVADLYQALREDRGAGRSFGELCRSELPRLPFRQLSAAVRLLASQGLCRETAGARPAAQRLEAAE